jgi:hypothetical protein
VLVVIGGVSAAMSSGGDDDNNRRTIAPADDSTLAPEDTTSALATRTPVAATEPASDLPEFSAEECAYLADALFAFDSMGTSLQPLGGLLSNAGDDTNLIADGNWRSDVSGEIASI